jgi:CheY-like chemotaxis protein/HPt (histidine-containing phosphotransfer) domain-containing protein
MSPQPIPKRVLVIDDDPMSRELLALLLEGEGYAVDAADSGESALDLISRGDPAPDLVLADVQLPGISGAQLSRKLRRACGPVTLLLAMSGSEPSARTIAKFDGFLLKPFRLEQVAAAVLAAKNQPEILTASRISRRTKSTSTAARTAKPASNKSMDIRTRGPELVSAAAGNSDLAECGPVLNETIYQQLAVSMPTKQLQEMYAMCVDDARMRIAGMRRLAAERDAVRFMREAHAIKGGCGMLGATELHRMAAKLEANGPDPASTGGAQNVNSLDELSAACDRLERMLGSRV